MEQNYTNGVSLLNDIHSIIEQKNNNEKKKLSTTTASTFVAAANSSSSSTQPDQPVVVSTLSNTKAAIRMRKYRLDRASIRKDGEKVRTVNVKRSDPGKYQSICIYICM